MIENVSIIHVEDQISMLKKVSKICLISGIVLFVISISLLYIEVQFIQDLGLSLIFPSILIMLMGIFQPIIIRKKLKGREYTYKYKFSDIMEVDVDNGSMVQNAKIEYSNILKYKIINNNYYLFITKQTFFIVKEEGFKTKEDKEFFLSKITR